MKKWLNIAEIGSVKMRTRIPKLPRKLESKIYKSGQTRGADDDDIYQNRVNRNNTVLIPYDVWIRHESIRNLSSDFENGYIVLMPPVIYFRDERSLDEHLEPSLKIGENCLLFYRTRTEWN